MLQEAEADVDDLQENQIIIQKDNKIKKIKYFKEKRVTANYSSSNGE